MAQNRVGGIIFLKVDSQLLKAKGNFTYNLGVPMAESILGADAVHGYKDVPQAAFIEGEITDSQELDVTALLKTRNATVTLELANGKVIVLRNAWFAGEGTGNTEEGNVAFRMEGLSADEVK
ncbi:phage tail tube protein [Jiella pelagia]|uniref:Phage tail tube protein n=1 Tax=Jiella pelagia TaxID=2986949 RepID=A0ABY7C2E1_9HYPH|nr:phage tail tube protein [Jiella pelagia]WAP69040.1 phage tail tube protein [Jiella pelagia]